MIALRVYLAVLLAAVIFYTGIVGVQYGWNLLPIFLSEIAALTWQGQFNLDFMCLLSLSGLWMAWRHGFSLSGIALGILGFFGGIVVLAAYLLFAAAEAKGDMKVLLLGKARSGG
ncbi:MAG: hypothetical protein P4L72_11785 [Parvibaculum sp.]|jgi:hypothetical protein|uniref:hypothetical protein n=1 Tax=Parvibaculum sp. TaxID=2024848 RepID=UPI00283DE258|nr:hypothetical protein [Parvibaculum sp.]MDR3499893.1 hypothetical protein [Parvibaculum sp.]